MYRLMISFDSDSDIKLGLGRPIEYLLSDEVEVCKVITNLSHLNPIITLFKISVLSADDVLQDFEIKEV